MSAYSNALDSVLGYFCVQIDRAEGEAARAELAQLRADLRAAQERSAEQARQLEAASSLIDQSFSDAVSIVNMSDGYVHEMAEHLANQLGAWLAANPTPSAEQQP